MTREEAADYLRPIMESATLPRYQEALALAVEALEERVEGPAFQDAGKLDRRRWEGCVVCNGCGVSGSNELLCNGTEAQYCPFCGRPLTEEAWAELERRINNGTAD